MVSVDEEKVDSFKGVIARLVQSFFRMGIAAQQMKVPALCGFRHFLKLNNSILYLAVATPSLSGGCRSANEAAGS
jgi:hypothetical protein